MIKLNFAQKIKKLAVDRGLEGPFVVSSSLWPYLKNFEKNEHMLQAESLYNNLKKEFTDSSIFFPCFSNGYLNSKQDIRKARTTTGILSSYAQSDPETSFTPSAFFSFAGLGSKSLEVIELTPENAWGAGSIYEYFELKEATFITIGLHPTQISYLHRLEWLTRDIWSVREFKEFEGEWFDGERAIKLKEKLFVRPSKPELLNDFTTLMPYFRNCPSFFEAIICNTRVSMISVTDILKSCLPAVQNDPKIIVKNRQEFK